VFGLSFGELLMLLLVAVVVLGPKELPKYLRRAGQLAGQLRKMAYDMRAKSGIDEVLRSEGIGADIAEIRRLANFARGELGSIVDAVKTAANGAAINDVAGSPYAKTAAQSTVSPGGAGGPVAGGPPGAPGSSGTASGPARAASGPPGTAPSVAGTAAAYAAAGAAAVATSAVVASAGWGDSAPLGGGPWPGALIRIDREREYPAGGADAYGALPEDATVYDGDFPASPLAGDPLYAHGDTTAAAARPGDTPARPGDTEASP
jgi:sec-independent protein translocase protein TatB